MPKSKRQKQPNRPAAQRASTARRVTDSPLKDTFDFIKAFIAQHNYPPTFREMANGMNVLSMNTIEHRVTVLQERGFLSREKGISRTIVLLREEYTETKDE